MFAFFCEKYFCPLNEKQREKPGPSFKNPFKQQQNGNIRLNGDDTALISFHTSLPFREEYIIRDLPIFSTLDTFLECRTPGQD